MEPVKESMKIEYPIGDYHKVWNKINPEPINKIETRKNIPKYEFGHRLFTKMMMFLNQAKFNKEAYNYYADLGVERQPKEEYQDYKIRQKFQKALFKYRNVVKQAIFMNMVMDIKAKQLLEETLKTKENDGNTSSKEQSESSTKREGNNADTTTATK